MVFGTAHSTLELRLCNFGYLAHLLDPDEAASLVQQYAASAWPEESDRLRNQIQSEIEQGNGAMKFHYAMWALTGREGHDDDTFAMEENERITTAQRQAAVIYGDCPPSEPRQLLDDQHLTMLLHIRLNAVPWRIRAHARFRFDTLQIARGNQRALEVLTSALGTEHPDVVAARGDAGYIDPTDDGEHHPMLSYQKKAQSDAKAAGIAIQQRDADIAKNNMEDSSTAKSCVQKFLSNYAGDGHCSICLTDFSDVDTMILQACKNNHPSMCGQCYNDHKAQFVKDGVFYCPACNTDTEICERSRVSGNKDLPSALKTIKGCAAAAKKDSEKLQSLSKKLLLKKMELHEADIKNKELRDKLRRERERRQSVEKDLQKFIDRVNGAVELAGEPTPKPPRGAKRPRDDVRVEADHLLKQFCANKGRINKFPLPSELEPLGPDAEPAAKREHARAFTRANYKSLDKNGEAHERTKYRHKNPWFALPPARHEKNKEKELAGLPLVSEDSDQDSYEVEGRMSSEDSDEDFDEVQGRMSSEDSDEDFDKVQGRNSGAGTSAAPRYDLLSEASEDSGSISSSDSYEDFDDVQGTYAPTSPTYDPTSPHYEEEEPQYFPTSPPYHPEEE
jgi:hypothetical protein